MGNKHKSPDNAQYIANLRPKSPLLRTNRPYKNKQSEFNLDTFYQQRAANCFNFSNEQASNNWSFSRLQVSLTTNVNFSVYFVIFCLLTHNLIVFAEEFHDQEQSSSQLDKVCKDGICDGNKLKYNDTLNSQTLFSLKPQSSSSNVKIQQFINKNINICKMFESEISSEENILNAELIGYKKYYDIGVQFYTDKIRNTLNVLFEETFYKGMISYFTKFSIEPTGLRKEVLNNNYAITFFVEKIICLDIKKMHEEDIMKPLLMNELQHLYIIMANERRYQKKLINYEDAKKYKDPFQNEKEKKYYLDTVKFVLQQFARHVDLRSYFSSRAFVGYFEQLAGYELDACKILRKKIVERGYRPKEFLNHRNRYVLGFKLNLNDQIYEFDTSMASIYAMLKQEDKKYFQPWVEYLQNYMLGKNLKPQFSQSSDKMYKVEDNNFITPSHKIV